MGECRNGEQLCGPTVQLLAHGAFSHRGVGVTQHGGHEGGFVRLADGFQIAEVAGEAPVLSGLFVGVFTRGVEQWGSLPVGDRFPGSG